MLEEYKKVGVCSSQALDISERFRNFMNFRKVYGGFCQILGFWPKTHWTFRKDYGIFLNKTHSIVYTLGEMVDIKKIKTVPELLAVAKWLEGKTLAEVSKAITKSDVESRVKTKGNVGYVIEKGFFGIEKNSDARPDIEHLGVEIKTCPLKYNVSKDRLSVKEPLSLGIINYFEEAKCNDITESALYKKNRKILLILYIHDSNKERSEYIIKYVFLWELDRKVLDELRPDYKKIVEKIRQGKAHEIHQPEHKHLTLCPKHSGTFKDPKCTKSKRKQPFCEKPAEVRAFRLKNSYMNLIISRHLGKALEKGGWKVD